MSKYYSYLIISIFFLSSCGGGGGGGSTPDPVTPAPVISFSATPTSAPISSSVTLSWSSSNASSCSASGSWQGSKGVSGSENIIISNIGNNDFSLSCSGSGGTSSKSLTVVGYRETQGVTVDGYIRGADIFIDTNENFVADSNEFSTTSDNDGAFNIRYDDGTLISLNGIDLDTNTSLQNFLISHKMDGHSEFKVISPVTTVSQFLSDPSILKPSLGIDDSIDVFTFDPVSNKSTSTINDYLYEKGNQLTVIAYTLQNISNNLTGNSDTSQDFFKAISEELTSSYNSSQDVVNIESKEFINSVKENVINLKSLNDSIANSLNITNSLSNTLPIIKVYTEDSITNAVFNFSISTLQTDMASMADGSISSDKIDSYLNDIYNYIADDQNIDVGKIKPNSLPEIITDLSALSINENEFNVGTIEAVDEDGDQIFFSLSGTDSSLLSISNTGVITFNASPDFEVPNDSDGDNNYVFNVSVTDDSSASVSGYDISSSADDNANVAVQNIDEDLIFFNLTSEDGTNSINPKLSVSMQIDSLTKAEEAQVLIEFPTLDDPDSTSFGDGAQQWIYSGINTNDGINWSITEELPSYSLSGNYKVRKLRITRGDLDDLDVSASTINAKGFETNVQLDNARQDITAPILQSISSFTITGNDGDESTNININFNATIIEDNLSEVRIFLEYPGGGTKDFTGTINNDGSVSFNIELDPKASSGTYYIDRFIISDLAGNNITYTNNELSNLSINNRWELNNTISDDNAPRILSLTLNPLYDNNDFSRKNIQVKVTTGAQESALERIYIRLTNEDGVTQIDEEFPSSQFTLSASEYTHTFALPFEYPSGTYNVNYIFIKDKAQNITNYSNSDIKSNSWDDNVKFEGKNQFEGKVIDGYISGAEVFIDQNFNFNKDIGELSTISQSNGSFLIGTDDEDLYQCLQNRPIVASVPVGAIDESLGEVSNAFRMILPSINDAGGNSSIVITPFTDLLSQSIINAKAASSITEDLSVVDGCQAAGDSIASSVSNEINQIMQTIESSFGISLNELISDYISGSTSSIVNETKAQRIGSFLPYFKLIQDEIDADLTNKYNKTINTNLTLRDDSINTILQDDSFSLLPIDFYTVYKTAPNSEGWYTEESVRAKGANLSIDGEIIHYKCITTDENCTTTNYSTSNIGDASEDYNNMTYFVNPDYSTTENVSFFIQDNRRWGEQTRDGQVVLEKDCVFTEQLDFSLKDRGTSWLNTRMNSSVLNYNIQVDTCAGLNEGNKNLFTAKTFTYEDSSAYETSEMQYINDSFEKSEYLKNKVRDPYTNRETIDLDALITELKGLPYKYKDLNKARAYANDAVGDRVSLNVSYRDQNGVGQETHSIRIAVNPDNDEYSKLERNSEGAYIETAKSNGQQARDDMYNALKNSSGLSGEDYLGTESVKDNRVSIQGKTIDGYISGATVFVDVNFNQVKDPGEYAATTDTNGVFELLIDANDEACVNARPLVADVPVGANDSTLGEVTEAYQMLLPSKNDSGSNSLVISPFTSLLTEAILKGKSNSSLDEDLTVEEGCGSAGDAVAQNISNEVQTLLTDIENTFGVSLNDLISDFIETGGSGSITENVAQKIASYFPYFKSVKDEISTELTNKYNKQLTPNVSLSKDSLDSIFNNSSFTTLPLEFLSIYKTEPNTDGFYSIEQISSQGAKISSSGVLKRFYCPLNDSSDCDTTTLNLNNVGNASKDFTRDSAVYKNDFTVDGISGNIVIQGTERRGYREDNGNDQFYCESEERIQFDGPPDSKGINMEYRYGFNRSAQNIDDCSILPDYGPNLALRVEKQGNNLPGVGDATPVWALQFGINSLADTKLVLNKVFQIVDNDDINPEELIKEVAKIPYKFSEIDEMRKLLSYGEGAFYYYTPTSSNTGPDNPFCTYTIQVSAVPRDDQMYANCYDGTETTDLFENKFGQEARDKMFEVLSETVFNYDEMVGASAPVSRVLFEYESEGVTFYDNTDNGVTRNYKIYPRYDKDTGWIDASLVGSEIYKSSIDDFINGVKNDSFFISLNVDAPFSSTENFELNIYHNDSYNTNDEKLRLVVELRIETLSNGDVQVTWLNGGKVTMEYIDDEVTISKTVINDDDDKSRTIPKGNYTFNDIDFLYELLDKVRTQFSSSELTLIKDFFTDGNTYSYKIDLGEYVVLDDFDGTSNIIAGTFGIANAPSNSVYTYYQRFNEGQEVNICFETPWAAESDITFNISPIFEDKPGFIKQNEANFSSTTVTIPQGESSKCVTFVSPIDTAYKEKQEFLYFNITNVINANSGRNIPIRLTIEDM